MEVHLMEFVNRRTLGAALASLALIATVLTSAPVAATVDKNPDAAEVTSLTCEDGSLVDAEGLLVGARSLHLLEERGGAPIMSAYLFESKSLAMSGPDFSSDVFFENPGVGLNANATWCWWQELGSFFGPWFGGHIQF